jgi:hypothetical protein
MSRDLDATLRDLAAGAAAAHRAGADADGDVLLVPTVRRVRRRRRVRAAALATGGLAAVTGLALGGFALAPEPAPQPAAPTPTPTVTTPAPTPSATPSATPEPPGVVLPTGDPSASFGTCGSLAGAATPYPVDGRFEAVARLTTTTAAAGSSLEVQGWVDAASGSGPQFSAVPSSGPRLSVVRDGVVVGTGLLGGDDSWDLRAGHQGEFRWTADWLPLAVCAADGQPGVSAGAPLPAGEYQLVPWADVADLGDSEDALTTGPGQWLSADEAVATVGTRATAVGAPVAFTVTGTAETVAPAPGSGAAPAALVPRDAPECSGPAPVPDPASPLVVDWQHAGAVLAPADLAQTEVTLRYGGGGRLGFSLTAPWLVVSRDGVVVGEEPVFEGDWRPLLATGTAVPITTSVSSIPSCDGSPLPAGTYEVAVVVMVMPDDREAARPTLVSEPATLVVP